MIYERQHKYVVAKHVLRTLLYEMLWRTAPKVHAVAGVVDNGFGDCLAICTCLH